MKRGSEVTLCTEASAYCAYITSVRHFETVCNLYCRLGQEINYNTVRLSQDRRCNIGYKIQNTVVHVEYTPTGSSCRKIRRYSIVCNTMCHAQRTSYISIETKDQTKANQTRKKKKDIHRSVRD